MIHAIAKRTPNIPCMKAFQVLETVMRDLVHQQNYRLLAPAHSSKDLLSSSDKRRTSVR